jgi:signal transduction histidine kinase
VFEPYVRLDKSGDNTGLGLTIGANAARAQAARDGSRPAVGQGVTAFIGLPRACAQA